MQIGIAGTGRMGTAIAQRLLERGHQVPVWNRTIERAGDVIDGKPTALSAQEGVR